ncbi:MAG: UDP-glucose:undecaprenyl-phosphate glucose-1-phosphate transferase [Lentisphaerae bacterium ADurb.Bin082]|nr:MAG: UDP-glucose:undecaprenyl-phosphate glucose-1-phosphate transferase [Lentisphaerae bacterium ADurb.Bin082]
MAGEHNSSGNKEGRPPTRLRLEKYRQIKAAWELPLTVLLFVVFLPLGTLLALLIKLTSPGPAIYRARRIGRHGRTIYVLKFRTMFVDADQKLEAILDENPELMREWQRKFKLSNDPRITPLGKILRRTSLDELPQLWNVLRGDMALVGPRPIVEQERELYGEHLTDLLTVQPGMTGLWQVSGRSNTTYAERVALDMHYVENWSPWLDLMILGKTLGVVLKGTGAV